MCPPRKPQAPVTRVITPRSDALESLEARGGWLGTRRPGEGWDAQGAQRMKEERRKGAALVGVLTRQRLNEESRNAGRVWLILVGAWSSGEAGDAETPQRSQLELSAGSPRPRRSALTRNAFPRGS